METFLEQFNSISVFVYKKYLSPPENSISWVSMPVKTKET